MTEKEMKKLSRAELLELLLVQTRVAERLQKRLEAAEAELAERRLQISQAGDLAHAVLQINGVVEAAQAAADQYLENIAHMEQETKLRCEQMLAQARQEADRLSASVQNETGDAENTLFTEIYQLLDNGIPVSGEE